MNLISQEFIDIVERDLQDKATSAELDVLHENLSQWKTVLLDKKKRTEMQFTSSNARMFEIHKLNVERQVSYSEWLNRLGKEKVWRVNANRFLQQIESRLREVSSLEPK